MLTLTVSPPASPSPITKESLTVLLRKLGYKFSEADRNDLFKLMDASSLGIVHFRDFVNSFALAERDSNNRFSFYKCGHAGT